MLQHLPVQETLFCYSCLFWINAYSFKFPPLSIQKDLGYSWVIACICFYMTSLWGGTTTQARQFLPCPLSFGIFALHGTLSSQPGHQTFGQLVFSCLHILLTQPYFSFLLHWGLLWGLPVTSVQSLPQQVFLSLGLRKHPFACTTTSLSVKFTSQLDKYIPLPPESMSEFLGPFSDATVQGQLENSQSNLSITAAPVCTNTLPCHVFLNSHSEAVSF